MPFELPKPGQKFAYFASENAPLGAPAWMIRALPPKTDIWEWHGKSRKIQHAMPDPFESLEEFLAFVAYLDHHEDFLLVYGRYQASVSSSQVSVLADGRIQFIFTNLPDEPDATQTHSLNKIHRPLYVCQKPWTPIPRLYRFWLKPIGLDSLTILPTWIESLQIAYQQLAQQTPPDLLEVQRHRFLLQYGAEQLTTALTDDQLLLTFFLGNQRGGGLYYELEHGPSTKGYGSIRGGSAKKFFVWRSGSGFRKRGPSRDPIACTEEEAIRLLRRIGQTLAKALTCLDNDDFAGLSTIEDSEVPLLHLGWSHKYLSMVSNKLSYHHQLHTLRAHLFYLTEQKIPQDRWRCDRLWRDLFEQLPNFRDAHPALLMLTCYKVLTQAEAETETEDDSISALEDEELILLPSSPLNTIFYGPPGTGKTYETARRAVKIIDGTVPPYRKELMARYRVLQREGRIGFVTFHQSYAYEDFIEGIRPVMDEEAENSGTPRYQIVDGILKELALNALGDSLEAPISPASTSPSFDLLWATLIEKIESDPDWTLKGLSSSEYQLTLTPLGNLQGTNVKGNAQHPYSATRSKIEKAWHRLPADVEPTHNALMAVFQVGTHTNLIGAVIKELRAIAKTPLPTVNVPEKAASAKALDFLTRGDDSAYTLQTNPPSYVLIVDEINRGNISKILGELITLLEDDKRIGKDNELTVTLPYSRQPFALPPNLYLIGTMNTADKSLALLDVALRRRFTFEELTPDFTQCDPKLALEMLKVLQELNRRITLRKDRDHRIGHAFFMNVGTDSEAFNRAFTGKIIPLLQEYFFNDWAGLRDVLGDKDDKFGFIVKLEGADSHSRNQWQWYTDADQPIDPLEQLKKNYGSNPSS